MTARTGQEVSMASEDMAVLQSPTGDSPPQTRHTLHSTLVQGGWVKKPGRNNVV